ncbi:30S ribosomal protein S5 [Candidatus Pacearchaeota archaeon]|nr:30S ribosomal protein S5 [Candidatus Pacearchaeota archaeon]
MNDRKMNDRRPQRFTRRKKLSREEMNKLREERIKQEQIKHLEEWKPKTSLGTKVKTKQFKEIDKVLNYKLLEPEIVDILMNTTSDILNIGQAKGKFGGGKRRAWRQTQKKTAEGNVPTFSCMAVIGNEDGYVGLGYGRAKETLPARAKAIRRAKLNIFKIKRGCASFDCTCGEPHTVPFIVEGKTGSCKVKLMPAPQGTGLVIGDECKKILKAAGIKDVYSVTNGKIRTTINLAKACIDALEKTNQM